MHRISPRKYSMYCSSPTLPMTTGVGPASLVAGPAANGLPLMYSIDECLEKTSTKMKPNVRGTYRPGGRHPSPDDFQRRRELANVKADAELARNVAAGHECVVSISGARPNFERHRHELLDRRFDAGAPIKMQKVVLHQCEVQPSRRWLGRRRSGLLRWRRLRLLGAFRAPLRNETESKKRCKQDAAG